MLKVNTTRELYSCKEYLLEMASRDRFSLFEIWALWHFYKIPSRDLFCFLCTCIFHHHVTVIAQFHILYLTRGLFSFSMKWSNWSLIVAGSWRLFVGRTRCNEANRLKIENKTTYCIKCTCIENTKLENVIRFRWLLQTLTYFTLFKYSKYQISTCIM